MALPKEPRQLMINLMYLVLTALLAMNVSSEILNAFKTIGKSIANSNKAVEERNKLVTEHFQEYINDEDAKPEKREKVKQALLLANQVNEKTEAIVSELKKYKQLIIDASGGVDEQGNIRQIENLDGGTRVMIEEGNGPKLLTTLKTFKDEIAGLVPLNMDNMVAPGVGNNARVFGMLPLNFETDKSDNNPDGDWSYGNFHMSPTIANITLLDKYASDVRASQSLALDEIWAMATGERQNDLHVTSQALPDYAVIVAADNNFVLPGEKYRARIMLGTYNKKMNNLSFSVNVRTIMPVDGVAEYTEVASAVGQKNVTVTASFTDTIPGTKQTQRRTITMPKPANYYVGEAQASISLDKMNVLYVGLANPITIAASGIPAGNINVTSENCTMTKTAGVGQYEVAVAKAGTDAKITLTGKLADGTVKNFGTYKYRVKLVPTPYPMIANSRGGKMAKNLLKAQAAVFAKLDDFAYELKFPVTAYSVTLQPKSGDLMEATATGELLSSPTVRAILDKVKIGDRIYFENIKCKAPDGIRSIGSVNFIITE